MINRYIKDLNKIEFAVTNACTGRCRHCSQGDHTANAERLDGRLASDIVRRVSANYAVKTVMVFGGEPLLHPEAVFLIMSASAELGIERRQVITNGYFSSDIGRIRETARILAECSVNDLLLSVDAFHQETIPLDIVKTFAKEAKGCGIPIRLQPAWLVSAADENPYNSKTREILAELDGMEIPVSEGNVIFPEGNAVKNLAEYFENGRPENPYEDDPYDIKCLSVSANGDVLDGNAYQKDIAEIIRDYAP